MPKRTPEQQLALNIAHSRTKFTNLLAELEQLEKKVELKQRQIHDAAAVHKQLLLRQMGNRPITAATTGPVE